MSDLQRYLINKSGRFRLLSSIYKLCLSVCPFASNNRQNGWTDWAQICGGTSPDPGEGLWMIEFSSSAHQNSILKILKIQDFIYKISEIFVCFCFTMYSETLNNDYIKRIHQMSYSSLSDNGMLQIFSFLIKWLYGTF